MALKATPYDGTIEFNEAWANMTRKIHRAMLAKPPARTTQPWPRPEVIKLNPFAISPASLKYKATKRIILLSQYNPKLYTPKYVPPPPLEHSVEPASLLYVPTDRILELAEVQPKLKLRRKDKRGKSEKRLRKEMYYRAHRHSWLLLRAAPKKMPEPTKLPKLERTTKPHSPSERIQRIAFLAKPRYKYTQPEKEMYDVSPAALNYEATDRIKVLANPRGLPEEAYLDMTFKPFRIKKSALKYIASERIKQLAVPHVVTKAVDHDVKDDPYSVPRRALKAKCTKRTKELAKPIMRD